MTGKLEIIIGFVQILIVPPYTVIIIILDQVGTKLAILMEATMVGIATAIITMAIIILAIILTQALEKLVTGKEFIEDAIEKILKKHSVNLIF
jgi:sulfite exporter TauE/SafE